MYSDALAKQAQCESTGGVGQYIPPTKRQQLTNHKELLEAHLAKINKALEALDKYPELEEFMNVIEQARI